MPAARDVTTGRGQSRGGTEWSACLSNLTAERNRRSAMTSKPVKAKAPKTPQKSTTWVVYIVQCADGTFYTGITNDLERRLKQHNAGTASRYTRCRLPVVLIYQEVQPTKGAALKRELEIKSLSRKAKKRLINQGA